MLRHIVNRAYHVVTDFLHQRRVHRMDWPACSPNLNSIEKVWDHGNHNLRDNHPSTTESAGTAQCGKQERQNLPQKLLRRHVLSIRPCCIAFLTNRGGYTHF